MGVRLKHSANRKLIEGKRVLLVDDSIVRGTTSTKIVRMIRDCRRGGSAFSLSLSAYTPSRFLRRRYARHRQTNGRKP